ncbi:serine hydrolase domain-containing protein [Sphaerisporangium aureirubrum]|uniref:Serine hydrolase domain-containing protein n=1 Tax=Sphaerisporangium aureirubrum TaxID=1544736 RepID=A0ABW1NAN8_9ACTN
MAHRTSPIRRTTAGAAAVLLGTLGAGCARDAPGPVTPQASPGATTGAPAGPPAVGTPGTSPPATVGTGDFPGTAWERGNAREAGFDPRELAKVAARARENGSNCLVVLRHGKVVADWYWNGTTASSRQEVFSATKSYTSTLVGIAEAEGLLDIDDKVSEYVPEWAGTAAGDVRIRNILSNDSGRHWDLTTDYRGLVQAADRTGFAVKLSQDAAPGKVWAYNNAAIQTLDAVLRKATGKEPGEYARERLLGPLGMRNSEMTRDRAGNTNMFFGLRSTCEDMARFGHLFLRGGVWHGARLVPARWVKAATGRPSQKINAAYGYLWWINARGTVTGPLRATTRAESDQARPARLVSGAPPDMYWAIGLGGQVIQVDPGSDTVVVRLGPGNTGSRYGAQDTAKAVTQALTEPGP